MDGQTGVFVCDVGHSQTTIGKWIFKQNCGVAGLHRTLFTIIKGGNNSNVHEETNG